MGAWIECFNLSLDCREGGGGRYAVDDDLLPDLILSEAIGSRNGGSDSLLNGKAVVFENSGGRNVVLCNKAYMVVGGELNVGDQLFLDCSVDCIANGEVVGVIR